VGAEEVARATARSAKSRLESSRELGPAPLGVVTRNQDVGDRVAQPGVAEVAPEGILEPVVVVLLVHESADGVDPLPDVTVEDLRPLPLVEIDE
jgi:hypothetical protein